MSSFYKKIALVCLVSLTANQAVQAFQLSDMWGWMKENPKKSFLISCVGAYVGAVIILGLKRVIRAKQAKLRRLARQTTTAAPASSHAQPATVSPYTYTTYASTWTYNAAKVKHMPTLMPDAKTWIWLIEEDIAELSKLSKQRPDDLIEDFSERTPEKYVTVARDQQNKIAGAIFYETIGKEPPICITHWHGTEGTLKAGLFKPLIKTGRDIKPTYKEGFISGYRYHDVMAEIEACDGVKPKKQFFGRSGEEETLFDRSEARAKRLLESGRDGSRAEASHG